METLRDYLAIGHPEQLPAYDALLARAEQRQRRPVADRAQLNQDRHLRAVQTDAGLVETCTGDLTCTCTACSRLRESVVRRGPQGYGTADPFAGVSRSRRAA